MGAVYGRLDRTSPRSESIDVSRMTIKTSIKDIIFKILYTTTGRTAQYVLFLLVYMMKNIMSASWVYF